MQIMRQPQEINKLLPLKTVIDLNFVVLIVNFCVEMNVSLFSPSICVEFTSYRQGNAVLT